MPGRSKHLTLLCAQASLLAVLGEPNVVLRVESGSAVVSNAPVLEPPASDSYSNLWNTSTVGTKLIVFMHTERISNEDLF